MNKAEFEAKLSNIPIVAPDEYDKESMKRISKNKDNETVTHELLTAEIEYSGNISLRLPKSLHKDLVCHAKQEGVSLNQYLLYKLSR